MSDNAKPPALRASDAERDLAVARLREAAAEGRLTLEEFGVRMERALAARTRDELVQLSLDLPVTAYRTSPPLELAIPTVGRELAILGSVKRTGRWRLGHEVEAVAVLGSATIDLRGAMIDSPLITIRAIAICGSVDVLVPAGVEVQMDGVAVLGSRDVKIHHDPPPPGAPIVRIECTIYLGSVTARGGKGLLDRALERLTAKL
jgi:hypothetical protein